MNHREAMHKSVITLGEWIEHKKLQLLYMQQAEGGRMINPTTDVHDFTTIDTPKAERARLGVGDIYTNAARCLACGSEIRSRNKHDFVTCSCGNVSVDGGSWYARRSFKDGSLFENIIVSYADAAADT